jgi:hypothetical protein
MKRILALVGVLAGVWIAVLFVLGFVLAGRTADRVAQRLGDALQATATIETAQLGLVRGNFTLERLVIRRDDAIGKLALAVGEVECDLPPLGIALVDRTCGELVVSGVHLDVSTAALFRAHQPKHRPLVADHVTIDNADIVFSPSAFVPSLGEVRVHVEHAEAGPTTFKTPLSFLFALEQLRAVFQLPAGITLRIAFADDQLVASGSLLGATPLTIPLRMPARDDADDAAAEIHKLAAFGKDLAERVVAARAGRWLETKLPGP